MPPSPYGSLLLTGIAGNRLSDGERRLLSTLSPAGVILFRKNFTADSLEGWVDNLHTLIADIAQSIGRERFLVSIDHEGGRVHRCFPPVTHFPPANQWREKTTEVTRAMALELQWLGFNLTFSPVADIHLEPNNPVIGPRSFGATPAIVAEQVAATIDAYRAAGMLSCAKHFPGHGATTTDSHFELPVLDVGLETLRCRELVPFASAVAAGVPLVMSAHVLYPQIDPQHPATFSRRILNDLLRGELGFRGVIVTDDLEMEALSPSAPSERAVLAAAAGADLLLEGYPKEAVPLERAAEMHRGLVDAVHRGELQGELLERSVARVEQLIAETPLRAEQSEHQNAVAFSEHQALAASLASIAASRNG